MERFQGIGKNLSGFEQGKKKQMMSSAATGKADWSVVDRSGNRYLPERYNDPPPPLTSEPEAKTVPVAMPVSSRGISTNADMSDRRPNLCVRESADVDDETTTNLPKGFKRLADPVPRNHGQRMSKSYHGAI